MTRLKETLTAAQIDEAYIRIIVTRGLGTAPSIDLDYAPGPPNYVILVRDLPRVRPEVHLALIPRLRTDRLALDPAIKSGNYLNNLLGLADARARGATECLFLNRDGLVTEVYRAEPPHLPWRSFLYRSEGPFSWGAGVILDALHPLSASRAD